MSRPRELLARDGNVMGLSDRPIRRYRILPRVGAKPEGGKATQQNQPRDYGTFLA
jgi:hypothetical protein